VEPARWRRVLAVNVEGVLACTQAVLPGMQARRYGRLVTVTSEAGRIGSKGNAVYAAAKAAVIGFTKSIARENARYLITANCVAPGPTETPMVQAIRDMGERGATMLQAMLAGTQLGRLGTADEIAAAVAFLASPEASYITAETLGVSGGMGLGGLPGRSHLSGTWTKEIARGRSSHRRHGAYPGRARQGRGRARGRSPDRSAREHPADAG
jgi:2-hydroxycyclohexanecarboxyl-CoA dehydrogenase